MHVYVNDASSAVQVLLLLFLPTTVISWQAAEPLFYILLNFPREQRLVCGRYIFSVIRRIYFIYPYLHFGTIETNPYYIVSFTFFIRNFRVIFAKEINNIVRRIRL